MKKSNKIKYSNESFGKISLVPDFLPGRENLVIRTNKSATCDKKRQNKKDTDSGPNP